MYTSKMKVWHSLTMIAVLMISSTVVAQEQNGAVDWSGPYVGAFGGYLSGEMNSNDPSHKETTGDFDDDSPLAGLTFGYNMQQDNGWVFGGELMLPLYIQKGTATDKTFFPDSVFYEASYKWGIMAAVKAGKNMGKALPYAFGSVGLTSVDGKTLNVDEAEQYSPGFVQSAVATHLIFQIGGGVDYKAGEKMFVGLRAVAFIGGKADHTMPWNEPGPNEFGYNALLIQFSAGYWF